MLLLAFFTFAFQLGSTLAPQHKRFTRRRQLFFASRNLLIETRQFLTAFQQPALFLFAYQSQPVGTEPDTIPSDHRFTESKRGTQRSEERREGKESVRT